MQQAPPPPPWTVVINQADGRPFYHNPVTNVSQWDYPVRPPLPPGPPPPMTREEMMLLLMQANLAEVQSQQGPQMAQMQAKMPMPMQIDQDSTRLRFVKTDRVVCSIEGRWAAGAVASLNEDDPADPTGKTKLPLVCATLAHVSVRASAIIPQ